MVSTLDSSLAFKASFMLLEKTTVMDNSDWVIVIQMIFLRLSAASKKRGKGLTQLSAVSGIQLRDQLWAKFTLGAGTARASSDTAVSTRSCHLDFST